MLPMVDSSIAHWNTSVSDTAVTGHFFFNCFADVRNLTSTTWAGVMLTLKKNRVVKRLINVARVVVQTLSKFVNGDVCIHAFYPLYCLICYKSSIFGTLVNTFSVIFASK